jgi:hypothetical protein
MSDKIMPNWVSPMSSKRIEFLLEELIYQQIRSRLSKDESLEQFNLVMENVDEQMKEFYKNLPDSK